MGQQKRNPNYTTISVYRGTLSRLLTSVKYGTWDEKINILLDHYEETTAGKKPAETQNNTEVKT